MLCATCDAHAPTGSIFCNRCGSRFEIEIEEKPVMPIMMTVEEATKLFFNNTISKELIYLEIRKGNIPFHRIGHKRILLDRNELTTWWNGKIAESKQKARPVGLRKIY
jgi:excisionase family DNA binding protein